MPKDSVISLIFKLHFRTSPKIIKLEEKSPRQRPLHGLDMACPTRKKEFFLKLVVPKKYAKFTETSCEFSLLLNLQAVALKF